MQDIKIAPSQQTQPGIQGQPIAQPMLAQGADLNAVIADFRRFSRFFLIVFVLGFIAILTPILMQAPQYTATASVMIDPRTMNTTPGQDVLSGLPPDTTTIDTEVGILKSSALADRVLTSLNLDQDPEFGGHKGLLQRFLPPQAYAYLHAQKALDFLFAHDELPAVASLSPAEQSKRHQALIRRILMHVSPKRQGLTRIIEISFTSKSPEKSRAIANQWVKLYLSQQMEAKFDATKETNEWLNTRLADLKSQAEVAETALQQYKIANNLMNVTDNSTIAATEITTLDQQLQTAKADQAETEARLAVAKQQMANGSNGEDVGAALNSPVVKDLRTQQAVVTQRIADLKAHYGPKYPDVIKAQSQLQDINAQIQAEVQRTMAGLEADAHVQQQRTASLQGSVNRARGSLAGNNQALVKLNELQRNADAVTSLYKSYLDRFQQTSSQSGLDKSDARIVANAILPGSPSAPKIPLALAMAAFGGFGLAVGAVLVRRSLDTGLVTSLHVESFLHQPYLGGIADLASTPGGHSGRKTPLKFILNNPLSTFAEGFRNLRASLIYSKLGEAVKVIAVTSSLPGEGKTTTSICLAQTMAQAGQNVLVIDCDLRRRSVSEMINKGVATGMVEVLSGTASLAEAIVNDGASGVNYLLLTKSGFIPKDLFGSEAFDRLLNQLRNQYDLIVLDTAPILPLVDTRILVRKADVVAMLVRWRKTPRTAVQAALTQMESVGVNVAGIALTQVNMKEQARYGYGDQSYFYGNYKKYYSG